MSDTLWTLMLLAVFALLTLVVVRTDRRRGPAVEALLRNPGELRGFATVLVSTASKEDALAAGAAVIQELGGRSLRHHPGQAVIGWKGRMLTNIPRWAQYQLVVLVHPHADGETEIACAARPRFSMNFLCEGHAQKLRAQLAEAMHQRLA